MKIAVPTGENGDISSHFGHCPSFTVAEINAGQLVNKEMIPNPGHRPGFLPKFLCEKGVNMIIAGSMGHRAIDLFTEENIEVMIGINGNVDKVLEQFIQGTLENGENLCNH